MNELKKKPEHISINIYFINILTYLDFYWFICVGASNGDILGVEAGVQLPKARNVPDQWRNVLGWSGSIQNITKIFVAICIGADQPGLRGPQGGCTPNFSSGCNWWKKSKDCQSWWRWWSLMRWRKEIHLVSGWTTVRYLSTVTETVDQI